MKSLFSKFMLSFAALTMLTPQATPAAIPHTEHAVLAGGCFWGMEAVFERLRGVKKVVAGFSGGSAMTAHYEVVSTGLTGHAESVEIFFDPKQISYRQILDVYFHVAHDPTELNYQGPDHGTQYRSAIFYTDAHQRETAEAEIHELAAQHAFSQRIVTQVVPLHAFYAAESYHQHYYDLHPNEPYIVEEDVPKVQALAARYPQLIVKK